MSTTRNYSISRVRGSVKAVKEDAFLTDRYLWSLIIKYAKLYIRRQDRLDKLKRFKSLYKPLQCVNLIEVDKIEACCAGVKSGFTIMRTEDKLPLPFEGPVGPMFRTISSLDGSQEVHATDPGTFTSMSKLSSFEFNTYKYYWYLDGYMYFPNIEWPAVRIEGVWEGDVSPFNDLNVECTLAQDLDSAIPDGLFAEIEQQVLSELIPVAQLPQDGGDDKQNIFR